MDPSAVHTHPAVRFVLALTPNLVARHSVRVILEFVDVTRRYVLAIALFAFVGEMQTAISVQVLRRLIHAHAGQLNQDPVTQPPANAGPYLVPAELNPVHLEVQNVHVEPKLPVPVVLSNVDVTRQSVIVGRRDVHLSPMTHSVLALLPEDATQLSAHVIQKIVIAGARIVRGTTSARLVRVVLRVLVELRDANVVL